MMDKVVFVAFFQGEVLANKVKRICDGYVMAILILNTVGISSCVYSSFC